MSFRFDDRFVTGFRFRLVFSIFLSLQFVFCSISDRSLASSSVIWIWSGSVTKDSAVVTTRLAPEISEGRLLVRRADQADFSEPVFDSGSMRADDNGIVRFEIKGLSPNTEYRYLVNTAQEKSPEGRIHTFEDGPMSFRIGFASCATTGSNHRVFDTLKRLNLHLFIHMGDFHYEDIRRNDREKFYRAYDRVLTSPRQGAFYRFTPVAYVWDDHDYGPNDSDGTSESKPAALRTFQQCVPHYPLHPVDDQVKTIQQAFTMGRVRFILTDPRAERVPEDEPDGPEKTMLGMAQQQWLLSELEAAADRYPLVVWINGVPWITKNSPGSGHGWEPYSWERTLIANRIKELGLVKRFLMISGDAHMVAADDGTHSNYASDAAPEEPAFPVFHAAPLDRYPQVKGGPYSEGFSAPNRWFPLLKAKQFGLMNLKDDGDTIQVELTGHNSRGDLLPNMVIEMKCGTGGCSVLNSRLRIVGPTMDD